MEPLIVYKANDGELFSTQKEAEDYESDILQLENICKKYFGGIKKPKGWEYIQHDYNKLRMFNDLFFEFIADKYAKDESDIYLFDNVKTGKKSIESVKNLVNELCPEKVKYIYNRLLCIRNDGREFSEPYYAKKISSNSSGFLWMKEKIS